MGWGGAGEKEGERTTIRWSVAEKAVAGTKEARREGGEQRERERESGGGEEVASGGCGWWGGGAHTIAERTRARICARST